MQKIKKLEKEILRHKSLYYKGEPEITDLEFDALEDELRELDPASSILDLVGTASSTGKVLHETKMLSLSKTYKLEELLSWKGEEDILSTYKIDGVSCSLIYENGSLVMAKTRGDGRQGENITQKILWINSIPKKVSNTSGRCEVRGELLCSDKNFNKLSKEMTSLGLDAPTSQRNIVAGLVSRKDQIQLSQHLDFLAFELIGLDSLRREEEKFEFLKANKFSIPEIEIHKNERTLKKVIEKTKVFMSEGDIQVDGIVFTYNNLDLHKQLGETAHHPRYKMAFKFQGESKTTTINEIIWSISRNGIYTPVAEVEPVILSGAKINRVTLHNFGLVKENNLKAGDKIEIIRSGEVIPKFISLIKSKPGKYTYPKNCTFCNSKIIEEDIRIFCKNDSCSGKNREVILNFIQKIGIDEISGKRLDEMMKMGLVEKIADLYALKKEDFLTLDKVKEKLADKFVDSIAKTKKVDLATFVASLGISGGAFNKSQKLVSNGIDTIDKFKKLTVESLCEIESFAEKSATEFIRSFNEKEALIDSLIKVGIEISKPQKRGNVLSGKKICITGSLSEKRSLVEDRIRENGGLVVGSVSKNTDYLLTNEKDLTSSKGKKAKSLGIKILTEKGLIELVS